MISRSPRMVCWRSFPEPPGRTAASLAKVRHVPRQPVPAVVPPKGRRFNMSWAHPLLLELFDAVHRDLAAALEMREQLTATGCDELMLKRAEQTTQRLTRAAAALEAALDKQEHSARH